MEAIIAALVGALAGVIGAIIAANAAAENKVKDIRLGFERLEAETRQAQSTLEAKYVTLAIGILGNKDPNKPPPDMLKNWATRIIARYSPIPIVLNADQEKAGEDNVNAWDALNEEQKIEFTSALSN